MSSRGPFVLLHIHPRAAEGDTLCLQSKTLLQGGFSRQQDTAAGPHHPMPGQTVRGTGMQGPYHLARGAWISRQTRNCAITTHAAFGNSANHGQKSFEHKLPVHHQPEPGDAQSDSNRAASAQVFAEEEQSCHQQKQRRGDVGN